MTFEEFFTQKKIDLTQLQRVKPALYEEFRSHYEQMGEKSFDHTKKYWFNLLRKDYLLRESTPVAPKTVKTAVVPPATPSRVSTPPQENRSSTTAPPTGLSSMSPSGFKPRFKPGLAKPVAPAEPAKDPEQQPLNQQEKPPQTDLPKEIPEQAPTKPLGFKPRFKAGVTKPAAPEESAKDPEQQPSDQQEKLGQTDLPKETPEQAPTKPLGFKPRFKPGITNKNKGNE